MASIAAPIARACSFRAAASALHAEPAAGSRFGGWGGGCSDVLTICSYQLNVSGGASLALNITFIARETLTVTTTSGGSVSSNLAGISCGSDCTEDYDRGATVVLTAAGLGRQHVHGLERGLFRDGQYLQRDAGPGAKRGCNLCGQSSIEQSRRRQ